MRAPLTKAVDMERLADTEYSDVKIKTVKKSDDGYELTIDDSLVGWFWWPELPHPQPKVGDLMRVYTPMLFGMERHGHALMILGEWWPIEYKPKDEQQAAREKYLREYEERRVRENRASRKRFADLSFLPLPLQRRIEHFRKEDDEQPDSSYMEGYEMAPVLEASRMLKRVRDPEFGLLLKSHAIKCPPEGYRDRHSFRWPKGEGRLDWPDTPEWRLTALEAINSEYNGYNYDLLKEVHPEMDDGHSGNTWDAALMMARTILRDGDEAPL